MESFARPSDLPRRSSLASGVQDATEEYNTALALLAGFYTRTYPNADELLLDIDELQEGELEDIVSELRNEVDALREETNMLQTNVETLRARQQRAGGTLNSSLTTLPGASPKQNDLTDSLNFEVSTEGGGGGAVGGAQSSLSNVTFSNASSGGTGRRGRGYRRKSLDTGVLYVGVSDKMTMLRREKERLKQEEEHTEREAVQVRDFLIATVEEAMRRLKELRLEVKQFCRAVLDEETGAASADELVAYMERRNLMQNSYVDKLQGQCRAAEQDIARAQQQLRQRRTAGAAFQGVDFEQLRIENEQFTERIDKRNAELVDLKGTSTRTVQSLNALMDMLNDLTAEQAQLRKEYKSRCEYLARCTKEVVTVGLETTTAERKNTAIRQQHEAVKVPKIEEYIAQTAELYELEKSLKNWRRKVEIAEGQAQVLRQQTRKLTAQRDAAVAFAEAKKKRLASQVTAAQGRRLIQQNCGSRLPSLVSKHAIVEGTAGSRRKAGADPVVAGSKSLWGHRRSQCSGSPSQTPAGGSGAMTVATAGSQNGVLPLERAVESSEVDRAAGPDTPSQQQIRAVTRRILRPEGTEGPSAE